MEESRGHLYEVESPVTIYIRYGITWDQKFSILYHYSPSLELGPPKRVFEGEVRGSFRATDSVRPFVTGAEEG